MTIEEALKELKESIIGDGFQCHPEVYDMAISALEKQIPKKPRLRKGCNWSYRCPNCGNLLFWTDEPKDHGIKYNYCPDCGQRIDWSEGEKV